MDFAKQQQSIRVPQLRSAMSDIYAQENLVDGMNLQQIIEYWYEPLMNNILFFILPTSKTYFDRSWSTGFDIPDEYWQYKQNKDWLKIFFEQYPDDWAEVESAFAQRRYETKSVQQFGPAHGQASRREAIHIAGTILSLMFAHEIEGPRDENGQLDVSMQREIEEWALMLLQIRQPVGFTGITDWKHSDYMELLTKILAECHQMSPEDLKKMEQDFKDTLIEASTIFGKVFNTAPAKLIFHSNMSTYFRHPHILSGTTFGAVYRPPIMDEDNDEIHIFLDTLIVCHLLRTHPDTDDQHLRMLDPCNSIGTSLINPIETLWHEQVHAMSTYKREIIEETLEEHENFDERPALRVTVGLYSKHFTHASLLHMNAGDNYMEAGIYDPHGTPMARWALNEGLTDLAVRNLIAGNEQMRQRMEQWNAPFLEYLASFVNQSNLGTVAYHGPVALLERLIDTTRSLDILLDSNPDQAFLTAVQDKHDAETAERVRAFMNQEFDLESAGRFRNQIISGNIEQFINELLLINGPNQ